MTTDTALLVSREVLQEQQNLTHLTYTDDPSIPMDDGVGNFLDIALPLLKLEEPLGKSMQDLREHL